MANLSMFLWANPIRKWPTVVAFFFRRMLYPRLMSRLVYMSPIEVRAMEYVIKTTKRGDAEGVLRALDAFGRKEFLMNVGDEKAPILTNVIDKCRPKVVLELGAYLGYSAIEIARHLPSEGKLISIELNALHAALADKLIDWAGLRDKVTIIIGSSSDVIPTLRDSYGLSSLDIVFLDHWKTLYVTDLKLLEASGLLVKGKTVVVGDNVLFPGAPDYLEYVTQQKQEDQQTGEGSSSSDTKQQQKREYWYDTEVIKSHLEYMPTIEDLITISLVKE